MILDGPLIRRRRQDLSMSQRDLAKRLGVSSNVVSAAEDGTNHNTLTLGLVTKLASALGVSLADLVVTETDDAPLSSDDQVRAVGSLLLETQSMTAVEAVAEALGLSLSEASAVLDSLERLLPSVGMVLHRLNGDVTVRPQATTDPESRERILRKHHARRGLSMTEAKVLYRVAHGRVDEGKLGNADRVALGALRRAGLVSDGVRPALRKDVVGSLDGTLKDRNL